MENSKLIKNTPTFEQNHRDSLELSPISGIPFASPELRPHGELRTNPHFFSAILTNVGQTSVISSAVYPWDAAPLVWAINRGEVLSRKEQDGDTSAAIAQPLDVTDLLSLSALEDYAEATHDVADFIFAGETERDGVRHPVLALLAHHENYLRDSHLNMQGPENQELSLPEYLAERTAGTWVSIRSYAEFTIDAQPELLFDAHALASAIALANWHASHRFDPATGEPTTVSQAGWSRTAPRGAELFPRTDPAVITAVIADIDGEEKLLLGNACAWEEHRYSTFAGFVEAGETLENAVARELFEECSGELEALVYRGSQPWPFPRSLMLGSTARISNPSTVKEDGEEIRRVRWFNRAELVEAENSGEIVLPGASSISRKLIDDWLHHADR